MHPQAQSIVGLEQLFWQSLLDGDSSTALELLCEPSWWARTARHAPRTERAVAKMTRGEPMTRLVRRRWHSPSFASP